MARLEQQRGRRRADLPWPATAWPERRKTGRGTRGSSPSGSRRYLSGVQERLRTAEIARATEEARAEEAEAKARAERRARRLTVALTASVVGLFVAIGGGWTYLQSVQAARRLATERAVVQDT